MGAESRFVFVCGCFEVPQQVVLPVKRRIKDRREIPTMPTTRRVQRISILSRPFPIDERGGMFVMQMASAATPARTFTVGGEDGLFDIAEARVVLELRLDHFHIGAHCGGEFRRGMDAGLREEF